MHVVNVAAYKFVELDRLDERRPALRQFCLARSLRGTILIAPEGINLFVAGSEENVDQLIGHLESDSAIGSLDVKRSLTDYQPFNRMLVRIKKEIIAFGVEGVAPARRTSPKLAPQELKKWLDEGRDITLLDTRNEYEIELGTFAGAERLGIDHFRQFPHAVEHAPETWREKPLVMFCTGGIRCEKVGPLLEQRGFRDVYQLDGGILRYFEETGGEYYHGDCFVFDQRVAVDAALQETDAAQCYACQAILLPDEQSSPQYVVGESCPHCFRNTAEAMRETIARRQERIRAGATPLPGSKPYDHVRPIHVSGKLTGLSLIDFLCAAVPSRDKSNWQQEIDGGQILFSGAAVDAARRVVAGEKYEHLLPGVVEPDVDADIHVLYEDAAVVVVDKPAPLPMHPGGRYNKNTLQHLLAPAYHPQRLRHAHRLDANTTGLVVLTCTRRMARRLQPQFERGEVEKWYLARINGQPPNDQFVCDQPIAPEPSAAGVRLTAENGHEASTTFQVMERYADGTSLVEAKPVTGRTNQIRAHLWSLGMPVLGDPTYLSEGRVAERQALDVGEPPMCLHAWKIAFCHPAIGERIEFEAPLPMWSDEPQSRV